MKKSLLTIAAALAMVGCMKDEIVDGGITKPLEGNAVVFSTYVGRGALASKATVFDIDVLKGGDKPEDAGFGVFAYYTGQKNFDPDSIYTGNAVFMNNTHVTWDNANGLWTYSPKKYWPNNYGDKVSFFAYAPYDKDAAAATPGLTDFVVENDVLKQEDIMWSNTKNIDLEKQAVNQYVNFNFAHALSRISFSVQAAVDDLTVEEDNDALDANTKIYVKRVALINNVDKESTVEIDTAKDPAVAGPFYTGGDLNMLPYLEDPDYDMNVAAWKDEEGAQGFVLTADKHFADVIDYASTTSGTQKAFLIYDGTGATNAHVSNGSVEDNRLNNDESYLMIIPQDLSDETNGGYRVYVEYDVVTTDPNGTDSHTVENNVISTKTIYTNFVSGKAYNLNIVLGMTSVKVNATETEWDSEDTNSENRDNYYSFEGEGTEDDPFLIPDAISLDRMAYNIEKDPELYANAYYKQTDDIDLSELDTKAERLNWVPMEGFLGHYDGGNFKITNLYFNTEEWVCEEDESVPSLSLFGKIGDKDVEDEDGASVSNLTVYGNVYASGEHYGKIATIASEAYNARFENIVSYVEFDLNNFEGYNVSGIVGESENVEFVNCANHGDIIMTVTDYGYATITGISGALTNSKMVACVNTGDIMNESNFTGGLAGITNGSQIVACYNTGTLNGSTTGGIAIMIDGTSSITASYNTGSIISEDDNFFGAITGQITIREPQQDYILKDVYYYNEGDVPAFSRFNYNNAMPEGDELYIEFVDAAFVDGEELTWSDAADNMNNAISDVYNDTDESYWDFEWHFELNEDSDTEPLVLAAGLNGSGDEGDDDGGDGEYSSLDSEPAFDNDGGVLHLKTSEDMWTFAEKVSNNVAYMPAPEGEPVLYSEACYEVDEDITIEGNWIPVTGFYGDINGNQKTITFTSEWGKMDEEDKEAVKENGMGLFSSLTGRLNDDSDRGEVDYVPVSIVGLNFAGKITGPKTHVGSLVGHVYKHVSIHYISSNMDISYEEDSSNTGYSNAGGIVGYIENSMEEDYSTVDLHMLQFHGKITDFMVAGGIVGTSYDTKGIINYCWNTGDITTDMTKSSEGVALGGIIGTSQSNVVACYNTGNVELTNGSGSANIGGICGSTTGIVHGVYNSSPLKQYSYPQNAGELVGYLVVDGEEDHNNRVNAAFYWGKDNTLVGAYSGTVDGDKPLGTYINIADDMDYDDNCDTLNMGIKYSDFSNGVIREMFNNSLGMYKPNESYVADATEGPLKFVFSGDNDWDTIDPLYVMLGAPDGEYYSISNNYHLRYLSWGVKDGIKAWTHGKFKLASSSLQMGEMITDFYPIGTYDSPFCGEFIGNGNAINNLYLSASDVSAGYYGLFGNIEETAVVDGVVLTEPKINVSAQTKGDDVYVGGIVGYTRGTVRNCKVENGDITATKTQNVAAVAGHMDLGTVSGNEVKVTQIIGNDVYHLGGVVGTLYQGKLYNNIFDGNADNVNDFKTVGDAGNKDSKLVVGDGTVYAGGIVGSAYGVSPIYSENFIAANISQGVITSQYDVRIGGIAGYLNTNKDDSGNVVTSDFFAGNVSSCCFELSNKDLARLLIANYVFDSTAGVSKMLDIKSNYAIVVDGINLQPIVSKEYEFTETQLKSYDSNSEIPMDTINNLWKTTYTGYGIKDLEYSDKFSIVATTE